MRDRICHQTALPGPARWAAAGLAAVGVSALACAAPAQDAGESISWDARYYNPQPADGDLVLPLPCGGAMVFREVDTGPADSAVADAAFTLGQEDEDAPFIDGLRDGFVAGPFVQDGTAAYFLGKYEIAQAQFDAVMQPACPEPPRRRDFVAATGISMPAFEAFAARLTLWLMAEHPSLLPRSGEVPGFLRIPTEAEWEFAARGGTAVDPTAFRAMRPPLAEGREPGEYIAHVGNDSTGGKVQVIGTLLPNPLGLHDMLGNVSEFVSTPFALVRHGRLHGQAGGLVRRGGDAFMPLPEITSATRLETSPYDTEATTVRTDPYAGARLAIGGVSIGSSEQIERIVADLDDAAAIDPALPSATSEQTAIAILDKLKSRAGTATARAEIAQVQETLAAARAERNSQRDQAIGLLLSSGVLMCDQTLARYISVIQVEFQLIQLDQIEAQARSEGNAAVLAQIGEARAEGEAKRADVYAAAERETGDYLNLVEGLTATYSPALIVAQMPRVLAESDQRGPRRSRCAAALETHLAQRRQAGFSDPAQVAKDLQVIAQNQVGK